MDALLRFAASLLSTRATIASMVGWLKPFCLAVARSLMPGCVEYCLNKWPSVSLSIDDSAATDRADRPLPTEERRQHVIAPGSLETERTREAAMTIPSARATAWFAAGFLACAIAFRRGLSSKTNLICRRRNYPIANGAVFFIIRATHRFSENIVKSRRAATPPNRIA